MPRRIRLSRQTAKTILAPCASGGEEEAGNPRSAARQKGETESIGESNTHNMKISYELERAGIVLHIQGREQAQKRWDSAREEWNMMMRSQSETLSLDNTDDICPGR